MPLVTNCSASNWLCAAHKFLFGTQLDQRKSWSVDQYRRQDLLEDSDRSLTVRKLKVDVYYEQKSCCHNGCRVI